MLVILACLALLNPDAALACVLHNPSLPPIVLGDTGTPATHGSTVTCIEQDDGSIFCTVPPIPETHP